MPHRGRQRGSEHTKRLLPPRPRCKGRSHQLRRSLARDLPRPGELHHPLVPTQEEYLKTPMCARTSDRSPTAARSLYGASSSPRAECHRRKGRVARSIRTACRQSSVDEPGLTPIVERIRSAHRPETSGASWMWPWRARTGWRVSIQLHRARLPAWIPVFVRSSAPPQGGEWATRMKGRSVSGTRARRRARERRRPQAQARQRRAGAAIAGDAGSDALDDARAGD